MNFLSELYSDDYYRQYLEAPSPLLVAVVRWRGGSEDFTGELAKVLQPSDSTQYRFRFIDRTVEQLTDRGYDFLNLSNKYTFKSDWCAKTVREQMSVVLLVLDWSSSFGGTDTIQKLNSSLEALKAKIRSFLGKVVVLCCYDHQKEPPTGNEVQNARRTLATFLGDHLESLLVIQDDLKNPNQTHKLRISLSNSALDFVNKHLKLMRDEKGNASQSPVQHRVELVRLRFMMSYLYCLVRETRYARQELFKSIDIVLRPEFPVPADLESRLSASVLLRHYLALNPLEYNSPDYIKVQHYIKWLGLPFASDLFSSKDQFVLAKVINELNKVEWLEHLAYATMGIPNIVKKDLLISAMYKVMSIREYFQKDEEEDAAVGGGAVTASPLHAPVYLGTECSSQSVAAAILSRLRQSSLVKRINDLLESVSHLGAVSGREEEILYFKIALRTPDVQQADPAELFLEKLKGNPVVITAVGQLLRTIGRDSYQNVPTSILSYYLLHSCIQTHHHTEREVCLREELKPYLQRATQQGKAPLQLDYPVGTFHSPLIGMIHFRKRVVEAVADCADIAVELHTPLQVELVVKKVRLTLSVLKGEGDSDGGEGGGVLKPLQKKKDVLVTLPDETTFSPGSDTHTLLAKVVFRHSGAYYCSSWSAVMEVEGAVIDLTYHCSAEEARRLEAEQRIMSSPVHPILHAVSPLRYLTVDGERELVAVEGETAVLRLTLHRGEKALHQGSCRIPCVPELFTVEGGTAPLVVSPSSSSHHNAMSDVRSNTSEVGFSLSYPLPDLLSVETTTFELRVRVLRGGRFRVPLVFHYAVQDSAMEVEMARRVTFSVDPPFSVSYSLIGSIPWREEGTGWSGDLPNSGDTLYTQEETNVLTLSSDPTFLPLQRLGEEVSLYFAALKARTPVGGNPTIAKGSVLTVAASVHCWARRGLSVWRADVVCGPGVRLRHTAPVQYPLLLEEKESATFVAQLELLEEGTYTPGFLRVLFSPHHSDDCKLFVDLCYPMLSVPLPSVVTQLRFPSTVRVNEPFLYEVEVTNASSKNNLRARLDLFFPSDNTTAATTSTSTMTITTTPTAEEENLFIMGETSKCFELRSAETIPVSVYLCARQGGVEAALPLFCIREADGEEVITRHTDTHRIPVV